MASGGSVRIIIIAFLMNLGIAMAKFVGFFFTSSAAMFAEGLHSLADTTNQVFLFLGVRKSKKAPTDMHPFGYGMEQYIWSFLVAILLFVVGATYSLYEGIHKIMEPSEIENPVINIIILAVGMMLEGYSSFVATKEFKKVKGKRSFWQFIRRSKNVVLITVLFEDYAALLGLFLAMVGNVMYMITSDPLWDAVSTLAIGLLLAMIAIFLYLEIKSLLLGESASQDDKNIITKIFEADERVVRLKELLTLHMAPDQILITAHVKFRDDLNIREVEDTIDEIEMKIIEQVPHAYKIFIESHQKDTVEDLQKVRIKLMTAKEAATKAKEESAGEDTSGDKEDKDGGDSK